MKHTLNDGITYLITGGILILFAYNAWEDGKEVTNTAEMGENLCNRLNILEFHTSDNTELTDCDEIYSGKEQ